MRAQYPDTTFGACFRLTLVTDCVDLARVANQAAVDLIGVDLEKLGKVERQAGLNVRISEHSFATLSAIMQHIDAAKSFVRLNPLNERTPDEIESALRIGARTLMLPYFYTAADVAAFIRQVAGRARVIVLLETFAATIRIEEILAVNGIDEVMVGLNDLRIAARVHSHFEVLVSPLMDMIAGQVAKAGLPLSIGGIAPAGATSLPVPADLVLAQYPRLNATGAWLSRSMISALNEPQDLGVAVQRLRDRLDHWSTRTPAQLEAARQELRQCIKGLPTG
jgi:hypothetical protein